MTDSTIDRFYGVNGGLAVKAPCRVATTANITLSGEQTINSVAVVAGDRVLVKDQTTASENGVYEVSTSAWTRAADFDGNRDVISGTLVLVEGGLFYELTTDNPITIGTSNLTFVISSASATDATLIALAALNSTAGIVVQTGTDTFTKRTLTGTANQVTVTNGDGVSGNPTFSLPQSIGITSTMTLGGVSLQNNGYLVGTTTAGESFNISAWDVDGAARVNFITLTANNTPTCNLSDSVTKSGGYIYRAGGTDVPLTDGGTGASTAAGARVSLELSTVKESESSTAAGTNAVAVGGTGHTVDALNAAAIGGDGNLASATACAIIGGSGNTVDGNNQNCVIVGGDANEINGTGVNGGVISGGTANSIASQNSFIASGSNNTISTSIGYSAILAGFSNTIDTLADSCSILSGYNNLITDSALGATAKGYYAKANKHGQHTISGGRFSVTGDAQASDFVVRRQTTNATPAEMFLDGSSLRLTIAPDTTWAFEIMLVARRTDADNESAAYQFFGCIDNNGGTTALVGAVQTFTPIEDTVAWAAAVTADNTNDALVITVTGEAAKTINWVARVKTVEVTG